MKDSIPYDVGAKEKVPRTMKSSISELRPAKVVPTVGLEPTRCRHQRILSPPRLPFRHAGLSLQR